MNPHILPTIETLNKHLRQKALVALELAKELEAKKLAKGYSYKKGDGVRSMVLTKTKKTKKTKKNEIK